MVVMDGPESMHLFVVMMLYRMRSDELNSRRGMYLRSRPMSMRRLGNDVVVAD